MVGFYTTSPQNAAPAFTPVIVREVMDLSTVIAHDNQLHAGSRYERYNRHTSITTTVSSHKFNCDDQSAGGAPRVFPHHHYGIELAPLLPSGQLGTYVERGSFTPAAGVKTATTNITLDTETDGWYLMRLVPYDISNVVQLSFGCVKYWITVDRSGQAKDSPWVVSQIGNFDWDHGVGAQNIWIIIPKALMGPIAQPLPERHTVTSFNTALTSTQLALVNVVQRGDNNDAIPRFPVKTSAGVMVTSNKMGYEAAEMFSKYPAQPDLDGPRGIATTPYPLFLRGGRNGKVYGMTPHSFFVVDSTGYKRTLCGITHVGPFPPHWETAPTIYSDPRIRIVGDWDPSIPLDERWPRECWGFVWDPRSLIVDFESPPETWVGGEPPHVPYTTALGEIINGPRGFFVDSLNRCVEVQFSGNNRETPPVCKVKIAGLSDPWSIAITSESTIAIAERMANKISEWNFETWTKIRDIVSSPSAALVGGIGATDSRRRFSYYPGQSTTTARTYDVVAPEGIDCLHESATIGRWLYYSSMAKGQVERIHLDTGVREHVAYPTLAGTGGVGSYFVLISLSDGSFGPEGTVFTTTFYNGPRLGKPQAFLPGGSEWVLTALAYGAIQGAGGKWTTSQYALGVSAHQGRLWFADQTGQIAYICKTDAYDEPISAPDMAKAVAGQDKWHTRGYSMQHGPFATSITDTPLPWGEDADMDWWMTHILRLTPP